MNEMLNDTNEAKTPHAQECWILTIHPTDTKSSVLYAFPEVLFPADELKRFREHLVAELTRQRTIDAVELVEDKELMLTVPIVKRIRRISMNQRNGALPDDLIAVGSIDLKAHVVDDVLAPLVADQMVKNASFRGFMDTIWGLVTNDQLPDKFIGKHAYERGMWSVRDTHDTFPLPITLYGPSSVSRTVEISVDYVALHPLWLPQ